MPLRRVLIPASWVDLQFTLCLSASELLHLQFHVSVLRLARLPKLHSLSRCRFTALVEGVQVFLNAPVLLSPQPLLLVSRVQLGFARGSTRGIVAQVILVSSEIEIVLQSLVV